MPEKIRIYFLGSGAIAVPVLRRLAVSEDVALLGVGTQMDRPAGRGGRLTPTPVGTAGEALGLTVDRIPRVNEEAFLERLRQLTPHFLLVVSFGQLLKAPLLALPSLGCVNIHASLLPRYRGASPVVSVIRNGETRTGVSFMKMECGLDTGPVYESFPVELVGNERADRLERQLGEMAAETVLPVLRGIMDGRLRPTAQDHEAATFCSKIRKADGRIDWRRPAREIEAMTRAYAPWPGASFTLRTGGREFPVTVVSAAVHPELSGAPGAVLRRDKHAWIVGCGEGALELLTVSAPGKREMAATAFLNGLRGAEMCLPVDF